jgi:uncharacterized protein (DUF305 family)
MVKPRVCAVCLAIAMVSGCAAGPREQRPPIVQPGAPGEAGRTISAAAAASLPRPGYTAADVAFMQGMIGHHAQALEMTGLLKTRSRDGDMRRLAERIEASQSDEIQMMEGWLTSHGQPLPDPHAHHHGAHLMPGMLSAEQMSQLADASGPAFDRLFLASMMAHHEGALVMVRELLALPGAAQDSDIFGFVSEVEADQKMEIVRMGAMLNRLRETQQ